MADQPAGEEHGRPLARGEGLAALLERPELAEARSLRIVVPSSFKVTPLVERLIAHLRDLRALVLAPESPAAVPSIAHVGGSGRARDITITVDLPLGPDADAFAAAAGRPTSLAPLLAASATLVEAGTHVRWSVPLLPELVHRLEALFSMAEDRGVEAVLVAGPAARPLDEDERLFAWDFITYRLLDEEGGGAPPARAPWHRALRRWLDRPGSPPPELPDPPLRLSLEGPEHAPVWALSGVDEAAGPDRADRSLLGPAGSQARQAAEVASVLLDGTRGAAQWAIASAERRSPAQAAGTAARQALPHVLLIGAYGGEHIGDAAILGGVLLRFHRRHGTVRAVLMSQRPRHTRHLVPMLDLPVEITVEEYQPEAVRARLAEVDAVVFAGGPLIDLPKQLVRHLYTVALARRHGKPFIAEGIGPGPFVRRPSRWTARRIVRMAERITVRTGTDAASPLLAGLEPEVGRDPAFDYLASRPAELSRLPEGERRWIDGQLDGLAGSLLVGLNIRPIRHFYTVGAEGQDRAAYTRSIEDRFEVRLAKGLERFCQVSPVPVTFVFFPMNAIQFGLSDLRSAYRIARHLGDRVDLRVWQADVSLDGVVALLRRLDIAITMRFHATIFALAQGCQVIGIDYRIGQSDKVAALLHDAGADENCCRIDQLSADWLVERLRALAATAGRRRS